MTGSRPSLVTLALHFVQHVRPKRAKSSRGKSAASLVVATVEPRLFVVFFWRMRRRGNAKCFVGVGPLLELKRLPSLRAKRLDVASPPFGVDTVEHRRRLSRARNVCKND